VEEEDRGAEEEEAAGGAGAIVDGADADGWTPLHHAAAAGEAGMVRPRGPRGGARCRDLRTRAWPRSGKATKLA
jgi:ankyrin repeat protein